MKRKTQASLPDASLAEIRATLPKSETIHLRVTKSEKMAIRAVAGALHLSITEYLVKCHEVVAVKIRHE